MTRKSPLGGKSVERDVKSIRVLANMSPVNPGVAVDHGTLSGLADDDHPQYGALAQNELVTGAWVYENHVRVKDSYNIQLGTSGPIYFGRYNDTEVGIHGGFRSLSPNFTSETTGWNITYDGNADFRRIFADELHVRAFIADIEQALAGGQIISKSVALLQRDFTAPTAIDGTAYLYVEDLPGFDGTQAFESGDYVRMRFIDRSGGGLIVDDIWGTVTSYADQGGGYQRWTFTLKDGPITGVIIREGAIVLDYGKTGQGYHEITTIDTKFSPYAQVVTWATNPWTPANLTVRTRTGNLNGITDPVMTPSGWGLYSDNVFLNGDLVAVGGDVVIDSDGIRLTPPSSVADKNSILWFESASPIIKAGIVGEYSSPQMYTGLRSVNYDTSGVAQAELSAISNPGASPTSTKVQVLQNQGGDGTMSFYIDGVLWVAMASTDGFIESSKSIIPDTGDSIDLGASGSYFNHIYVNTIHATTIEGDTMGGITWQADAESMYVNPDYAGTSTLYIANTNGSNSANLDVEGSIVVGGTVDGVDVATFKSGYDTHVGNANAHHNRSHVITGASDHTVTGSALDLIGLSTTDTLAVVTPSADPAQTAKILKTTAGGLLTLYDLTVTHTLTATINVTGTTSDSFTINNDLTDANIDLVFGRTTGGSATMRWNGTIVTLDKTFRVDSGIGIGGDPTAAGMLYVTATGSALVVNAGQVIFNESGGNYDFRVEGDTDANLLFADASADNLGVGLSAPLTKLHVQSTGATQFRIGYDVSNYANLYVGSGGVLTIKPTGDLVLDPTGNDVLPEQNYDINLGALSKKYLTLHAAELWVETLVAQNTIATIGGRILVGPTTTLVEDWPASQTRVIVKHNEMAMDDTFYMEADSKVEFNLVSGRAITQANQTSYYFRIVGNLASQFKVGDTLRVENGANEGLYTVANASDVSSDTLVYVDEKIPSSAVEGYLVYTGVTGSWTYLNCTRNRDGTGSNDWYAGDACFNTGGASDGFIDLYSVRGVKSGSQYGPTIVGNVRNSTTFNDWTEHWAIGNLNGVYGYGTNTYGLGLGKYGADHITIDASNGIRFKNSAGTVVGYLSAGVWALGSTAVDHVEITTTAISLKDSTTTKMQLQTDGDFFLGSNIAAAATTYLSIFAGAQTYNGESMGAGDMLIGNNSASKANILWDYSTGRLNFRGGTTTQAYIDTDGSITAGNGAVTLNTSGINIATGTGTANKINWTSSGSPVLEIYSGADGNFRITQPSATTLGRMLFYAQTSGAVAQIELAAGAGYSLLAYSSTQVSLSSTTITLTGAETSINQGSSDGICLQLKSSDVAHGITAAADTDVYGFFKKLSADYGGLNLTALSESAYNYSLFLRGGAGTGDTTKSTTAAAPVCIDASKKSTTALTSMSSNENLLIVRNYASVKFIVDAEGDLHVDGSGSLTTYDDYDDLALVRGFEMSLTAKNVDQTFGSWIDSQRSKLIELGILSEGNFINATRLQRLQNGALWQLHERIARLERLYTKDGLQ